MQKIGGHELAIHIFFSGDTYATYDMRAWQVILSGVVPIS